MHLTGMDRNFWQNRRVLITGHTGFKGCWLSLLLSEMGAEVHGFALEPETHPSLFVSLDQQHLASSEYIDVMNRDVLTKFVQAVDPEIVFHLAAQPLVRQSYKQPLDTFAVNVMGTAHVLQACSTLESLKTILVITTDKVYENSATGQPFSEGDPLGGHDPYSASKACAEIVTASYARSFLHSKNIRVATARAGNVIGGGDWSEDRLIPDAVRAWQARTVLAVRNTQSIRPWQHVIEPLVGYSILAQKLTQNERELSPAYNFGPKIDDQLSVGSILDIMRAKWNLSVAESPATDNKKEAAVLRLDCQLAEKELGVYSRLSVNTALEWTMDWYKQFYLNPKQAKKITLDQIRNFLNTSIPEKIWGHQNELIVTI